LRATWYRWLIETNVWEVCSSIFYHILIYTLNATLFDYTIIYLEKIEPSNTTLIRYINKDEFSISKFINFTSFTTSLPTNSSWIYV
jgi:hypothetical protein